MINANGEPIDGLGPLPRGATPYPLRQSPLALVGSRNEVAERIAERRERWGYSYHVIPGDKARDFAPLVADLTGT